MDRFPDSQEMIMNFVNRWSIKTRLIVGYSLLTIATVFISIIAIRDLGVSNASFEHQVLQVDHLLELGNNVVDAANARAVAARNLVISTTAADVEAEKNKIAAAHAKMGSELKALKVAVAELPDATAGLRKAYDEVVSVEAAYGPVALEITRLGVAGERERAISMINSDCRPLLIKLIKSLGDFLTESKRISQTNVEKAGANYQSLRIQLIAVGLLTVAVAIGLALSNMRSILRPLGMAHDAAREFAQGNLTREVRFQGKDELAQMLETLESMRQNLVRLVSSVRQGSESVSTASAEIARGNQDLSTRTESQASALEETAASMEELGSTVKQNADNARQANQLAQSASSVAVQGGEVVAQVVDTMKGINDSSRKIADIISVIDGIAFQTNILALNAAVEAARAGEQGRGFAVVAGEVRTLASRSAEAAKEIKELITDSVQRVEQGSAQVDQAGRTMDEVVASIRRVTDIMGEISAASSEQSQGVAQIGEAVTNMDHTTQQNAAMVEEMAAAASNLKSQALELVQAVSVFRLNQGDDARPAALSYQPA